MSPDKFIAAVESIRKTLQRAKLRFTIDNRDPNEWVANFKAGQEFRGPDSRHCMDATINVQPKGFWGDCVYSNVRFMTGRGLDISVSWSSGGRDPKELPCCLDAAEEHARAVNVLTMAVRRAKAALTEAAEA
jgi:hypothetical protein